MIRLLIASVLSATAIDAAAQVEARLDFKGMRLGDSIEQLRASAKLTCARDTSGRFDTVCTYTNARDKTYATEPARSVVFGLFDDRLDTVEMEFAGAAYPRLKTAMDGKFGAVAASPDVNGLCVYRMNGDRAYLLYRREHRTTVLYEAAAGAAERERREALGKGAVRKDM